MAIDRVLFGAQVLSTKKDQQFDVKTLWACGQSSPRIRRRTWWLQISLSRGDATSALAGFSETSNGWLNLNLEMLHGFLDGGKP